jgi:hypothetical protein
MDHFCDSCIWWKFHFKNGTDRFGICSNLFINDQIRVTQNDINEDDQVVFTKALFGCNLHQSKVLAITEIKLPVPRFEHFGKQTYDLLCFAEEKLNLDLSSYKQLMFASEKLGKLEFNYFGPGIVKENDEVCEYNCELKTAWKTFYFYAYTTYNAKYPAEYQ